MRLGTLLMLLVAIAAGVIAVVSARTIIRQRTAAPTAEATTIVVAAATLPYGTEITNENVIEIPWATSVLPEGSFRSKGDLLKDGRRVALSKFEANEPILNTRVTGPGQRASLSTLIDPGMRAVTLRVDDVRGVAGFVMPGDRVDVVLIRGDGGSNASSFADVLLQDVKVLAVDQLANEKQEKPTVARAVTVEVSTEQAQKLVLAAGVGNLSLVLRQAGVAGGERTRRVSVADLANGEDAAPQPGKKDPLPTPRAAEPVVTATATVTVHRAAKDWQDYTVLSENR
jgi:pilus assembly protein CpaB